MSIDSLRALSLGHVVMRVAYMKPNDSTGESMGHK